MSYVLQEALRSRVRRRDRLWLSEDRNARSLKSLLSRIQPSPPRVRYPYRTFSWIVEVGTRSKLEPLLYRVFVVLRAGTLTFIREVNARKLHKVKPTGDKGPERRRTKFLLAHVRNALKFCIYSQAEVYG